MDTESVLEVEPKGLTDRVLWVGRKERLQGLTPSFAAPVGGIIAE